MLKLQKGEVTRIDSARTIAGRIFYWSTAYYVDGLLVDTGCAHSAQELADVMRGEKLEFIINTHTHEDHIGANGILQELHEKVEICAHPTGLPVLENPRQTQPLQFYRQVFWGWPQPSIGSGVRDGQLIEISGKSFEVIYTPGHSPDHICLYEQQRGWLFSGDLFVGGKDRALRADNDIYQIIASLKRIAGLQLTRLFPGSARIRENPHQELLDKIDYLEEIGDRVITLHKRGWSARAISRKVFGGPLLIEFATMGDFTRMGLVKSYIYSVE
jgi:glyoxylase-like metal-dependent hydrolase (beta-lactamase superfamily II)